MSLFPCHTAAQCAFDMDFIVNGSLHFATYIAVDRRMPMIHFVKTYAIDNVHRPHTHRLVQCCMREYEEAALYVASYHFEFSKYSLQLDASIKIHRQPSAVRGQYAQLHIAQDIYFLHRGISNELMRSNSITWIHFFFLLKINKIYVIEFNPGEVKVPAYHFHYYFISNILSNLCAVAGCWHSTAPHVVVLVHSHRTRIEFALSESHSIFDLFRRQKFVFYCVNWYWKSIISTLLCENKTAICISMTGAERPERLLNKWKNMQTKLTWKLSPLLKWTQSLSACSLLQMHLVRIRPQLQ